MTILRRAFLAAVAAILGLPMLSAATIEVTNFTGIDLARGESVSVVWRRGDDGLRWYIVSVEC